MPLLATDDMEEGMILAKDVRSVSGHLLVPQGIPLKPFHIRALNRSGVKEIEVVGESLPKRRRYISPKDISPDQLKKMKQELEMHFGGVQHTEGIGEVLFNSCLERKARRQHGTDE